MATAKRRAGAHSKSPTGISGKTSVGKHEKKGSKALTAETSKAKKCARAKAHSFGIWRECDREIDNLRNGWFPLSFDDKAVAAAWLATVADMSAKACSYSMSFGESHYVYEAGRVVRDKCTIQSRMAVRDGGDDYYRHTLVVKECDCDSGLRVVTELPFSESVSSEEGMRIASFLFPAWKCYGRWNKRWDDPAWLEELGVRTADYLGPSEYHELTKEGWPNASSLRGCLPVDIDEIPAWLYEFSDTLESVTVPEGVKKIGRNAFYGCRNLKAVVLPSTLEEISESAFSGVESLGVIDFPESLKKIGAYAFYHCSSLRSLRFPNGLLEIGERAFEHCAGISKIEITDNVLIGKKAFGDKDNLLPVALDQIDWEGMEYDEWTQLLQTHPGRLKDCTYWNFAPACWKLVLMNAPEYAEKCKCWKHFDNRDWIDILTKQPQFADLCDEWDSFSARQWNQLMQEQPQFAVSCKSWGMFDYRDWFCLLKRQPQFADRCDKWQWFGTDEWMDLLKEQPSLAPRCDKWKSFKPYEWADLLSFRPEFADLCKKWTKFGERDWGVLLARQPQFIDKCVGDVRKLNCRVWEDVLKAQPLLWTACPLLDEFVRLWVALLTADPELKNRFERWNDLSGDDWVKLLVANAEFGECFDRHSGWKASSWCGWRWRDLLKVRPQFADRCDQWDDFDDDDWDELLEVQPQLSKYRKGKAK